MSDPNSDRPHPRDSVEFDPTRIVDFLREAHPLKTAESVEAASGVPADTVRGWLKGATRPGFAHSLALIGAYGPAFLVAAMPRAPKWLDEAHRAEQRRALSLEIERLARRREDLGT